MTLEFELKKNYFLVLKSNFLNLLSIKLSFLYFFMIKKETIPNKSDFYKFTFKFKHLHCLFYTFL